MSQIQFNKTKGEILKSMMRRPETAKLIREAMSSPIGSTSRSKAKKLFSIMEKLSSSHDGAGGPGMTYERMGEASAPEMDPIHIPTDESKGLVIFHKLPTPNINFGGRKSSQASKYKPRAGAFDGSGGPGVYDGKGGAFDAFGSLFAPLVTPFTDMMSTQTANSTSPYSSLFSSPANAASPFNLSSSPSSTPAPNMSTPQGPAYSDPNTGKITYMNTPSTPSPSVPYSPAPTFGFTPYVSPAAQYSSLINTTTANSTPAFSTPTQPVANMSTPKGPAYVDSSGKIVYTNLGVTPPITPTVSSTQQNNNSSGGTISSNPISGGLGSAATNYSTFLKVDPATPLSQVISSVGMSAIVSAIKANEGHSPAGVINNPGNIKFNNLPGQTNSGVSNDGGKSYFANYATAADGDNAIASLVNLAANGGSSYYGQNPTLSHFADVYTGQTSGSSSGSGTGTGKGPGALGALSAAAAAAANPTNPMGAGMFAFNNNNMPQASPFNQAIWDRYGTTGLQNKDKQLLGEEDALLTARNRYLLQSSAAIDGYMQNLISTTDLSDPANVAMASKQLSYLYTLRGNQTQSYLSYLNTAIDQTSKELDQVNTQYTTALQAYETDLNQANVITDNQYKIYSQALSDMYTAVDQAPTKAAQLAAFQQQALDAHYTAIKDATGAATGSEQLAAYPKMQEQIYDSKGFPVPGLSLSTILDQFSATISSPTLEKIYNQTITKALSAPSGTNDANGNPINKTQVIKMALSDYAKVAGAVAMQALQDTNPANSAQYQTTLNNTVGQGEALVNQFGSIQGGEWGANANFASNVKALINTIGASGFFGGIKVPTMTEFLNDAKNKGIDSGLATSLYNDFKDYMSYPNSTATDWKTQTLSAVSTQSGYNNATNQWTPLSDQELATSLGQMYANDMYKQYLKTNNLQYDPVQGTLTIIQNPTSLQM